MPDKASNLSSTSESSLGSVNETTSKTSVQGSSITTGTSTRREPIVAFIYGYCNKGRTSSSIGAYLGHRHQLNVGTCLRSSRHSKKLAEIAAATKTLESLRGWAKYNDEPIILRTNSSWIIESLKDSSLAGKYAFEIAELHSLMDSFLHEVTLEHSYGNSLSSENIQAKQLAIDALPSKRVSMKKDRRVGATKRQEATIADVPNICVSDQSMEKHESERDLECKSNDHARLCTKIQGLVDATQEKWDSLVDYLCSVIWMFLGVFSMCGPKKVCEMYDSAKHCVQDLSKEHVMPIIESAKKSARSVGVVTVLPVIKKIEHIIEPEEEQSRCNKTKQQKAKKQCTRSEIEP